MALALGLGILPPPHEYLALCEREKKCYWLGMRTNSNRHLGGCIDGDRGVRARTKVPKLAQNIFNNQQWLEAAMEGSGGVDGGQ